jgi:hypothetical protein
VRGNTIINLLCATLYRLLRVGPVLRYLMRRGLARNSFNAKMAAWGTATNACNKDFTCVTRQDAQAASYVSAFASQVQAIAMPSNAEADAAKLVADATSLAGDFTTLSRDKTVAEYQADVASSGLTQDLQAVQTDMNNVNSDLNSSTLN